MSSDVCSVCERELDDEGMFCELCDFDTCFGCSADDIYYEGMVMHCSHGCEIDFPEVCRRRAYSFIFSDDAVERLRVAGCRPEIMIPNGVDVVIHEEKPDCVLDGYAVGLHHSYDVEGVIEDELMWPSENPDSSVKDSFEQGDCRYDALYCWPFDREFLDKEHCFDTEGYVYFSFPKSDVSVSSYRFIDIMNEDEDFPVSKDKYLEKLTFSYDTLVECCRKYDTPCPFDALIRV